MDYSNMTIEELKFEKEQLQDKLMSCMDEDEMDRINAKIWYIDDEIESRQK